MSILDYKILSWIQSVSSLQDQPNQPPASMTAAELKAAFDSNSNQLKDALNALIDYLNPSIDGPQALFVAEYGTTTSAEIEAAYQAGNFIAVNYLGKKGIMSDRVSATKHRFVLIDDIDTNTYKVVVCKEDLWAVDYSQSLASLSSPDFTGTPTAPTATAGTNTTQIATTAFVQARSAELDNLFIAKQGVTTVSELEAAYQAGKVIILEASNKDNGIFPVCYRSSSTDFIFATVRTLVGSTTATLYKARNTNNVWTQSSSQLAPVSSPSLSGTPTAPTAAAGTNTTQIATTAFVKNEITGKLDKSGGTMTGTLTLAGAPSSNLEAATKKYVDDAAAGIGNFFIAKEKVTTVAELETAYQAGKVILLEAEDQINGIYPVCYRSSSTDFIFATVRTLVGSTTAMLYKARNTNNVWTQSSSQLAPVSSPSLSGTPTAPTAAAGTNTTQIATTAFVKNEITGKLDKSGGTMTGTLTLAGAPSNDLEAATKKYVDDICGDIETALTTINTALGGLI